jgi:hypothetical protein
MPPFQPHRRLYGGPIDHDSQPRKWMKTHNFASRDWIESQVRYGKWIKDRNSQNGFLIYATNIDGTKTVTVLIKITFFETHVLVYHIHLLR